MIQVEFTKPYAGKKKGDKDYYDSQIANSLVRVRKVAKVVKASYKLETK